MDEWLRQMDAWKRKGHTEAQGRTSGLRPPLFLVTSSSTISIITKSTRSYNNQQLIKIN